MQENIDNVNAKKVQDLFLTEKEMVKAKIKKTNNYIIHLVENFYGNKPQKIIETTENTILYALDDSLVDASEFQEIIKNSFGFYGSVIYTIGLIKAKEIANLNVDLIVFTNSNKLTESDCLSFGIIKYGNEYYLELLKAQNQ